MRTKIFSALSSKLLPQHTLNKYVFQRNWLQELVSDFKLQNIVRDAPDEALPTVVLYGSTVSGTAFAEGDADYAVLFSYNAKTSGKNHCLSIDRTQQEHVLSQLYDHVNKKCTGDVRLHPQRIFKARIPILQYVMQRNDDETQFDVSLSVDGAKNSLLLRKYMEANPRLRLGALLVKQWGKEQKILNARSGFISPYALTIMYIFFMQRTGRAVQCLDEIDVGNGIEEIVGGLHASVLQKEQREVENVFDLVLPFINTDIDVVSGDLKAFFEFYGNMEQFDFDTSVVDIRKHDRILEKDRWLEKLVDLDTKERWHLLGYENLMLRDPFESHNLGRSVDFFRGENIREAFRLASLKNDPIENCVFLQRDL